ncbi:MAG TPA: twin-arginine translocation signal domain-containing protein [Terriglobales bacterium]|nr:twin-arginine translocation signal domain-containing protein [Terriglobales bacterium]
MESVRFEAAMFASPRLTRRNFLRAATLLAVGAAAGAHAASEGVEPFVQTVLGPIPASTLGVTLAHEHVMCDFIGAEHADRHRWEVEAVVKRMRPVLAQLKERGVTGFVDCTPAYIGRDPRVLKRLAQETGLHILTNTGYYGGAGDKFVPQHAYDETADQLADRWVREWENGIEDSGVKPGFVKIGIDEIETDYARLSPIDEKLVRASARASKRTGLAVTCHTGGGPAGLAAAKVFIAEKTDPGRFIVAHCDGHGLPTNQLVAELGARVSFDAISRKPLELHLKLVRAMTERHASSLLLSHDNGWYEVGRENGGEIRDFNYISDVFLPAFRKGGASEATIRKLTVENPANAFAIRPNP